MTSRQIDCAIELSRTLNFRKAAENLYISQPSLSYQIQSLEREIGYLLFNRSGKGAVMTPAGEQFCHDMVRLREEYTRSVERGKNISSHYKGSLSVSIPMRSAIHFLPQIMRLFQQEFPAISLNIHFLYGGNRLNELISGNDDILFERENELSHITQVKLHHLFDSHIYLVTLKDDPLASLSCVTPADLTDRLLMIGGGSPPELKEAQEFVMRCVHVNTFNSPDVVTTMTNIAAGNGICLVPGFCNDYSGEFAWLPVSFDNPISCTLGTRADDKRLIVQRFIDIAKNYYDTHSAKL